MALTSSEGDLKQENSMPCGPRCRWMPSTPYTAANEWLGPTNLNHPIEKEHHLEFNVMFGFNMLTYSN